MPAPLVSSDALPALRRALLHSPGAAPFDAPRLRVVVDANTVLRELYWNYKTRRDGAARTHFREVVDAGVIVPFAPPQLHEEVVAKFGYFRHVQGIPEDVLQGGWKDLSPLIRRIPPRSVRSHASTLQALARRDPKDLPYAALAMQIGAAGVLTVDPDFTAVEVNVFGRKDVAALRTHARGAAIELAAFATGSMTLNATAAIAHDAWRAFRRLPPIIQLAIVAFGLGAVAGRIRSGRAKRPKGLAALWDSVAPAFETLVQARSARRGQPVSGLANGRPYALVDFAAVACAEAALPLDVDQIAARAVSEGYRADSRISLDYLRRVISRDGRFTRHGRQAWTLAVEPT